MQISWINAFTGTRTYPLALMIATLLTASSAHAALSIRMTGDLFPGGEASMATLAGADGNFVAAFQSTLEPGVPGADRDIFYTRSTDAGAHWSAAAPLPAYDFNNDTEDQEYPSIATNGAGTWILVWNGATQAFYSVSGDDGLTWSDALPWGTFSGNAVRVQVGASGTHFVAAAGVREDLSPGVFRYRTQAGASINDGASWSFNTLVSNDAGTSQAPLIQLAVGADGRSFVRFSVSASTYATSVSPDFGLTWLNNIDFAMDTPPIRKVSNSWLTTRYLSSNMRAYGFDDNIAQLSNTLVGATDTTNIASIGPRIAGSSNNHVAVTYRSNSQNDILMFLSTNGGSTWPTLASAKIVNYDTERGTATANSAIATDDNGVWVALYGVGTATHYSTLLDAPTFITPDIRLVGGTTVFGLGDDFSFTAKFSSPVTGCDLSTLKLTTTGTAAYTHATIIGSGADYQIFIQGVSGVGDIRLRIPSDTSIVGQDGRSVTAEVTRTAVSASATINAPEMLTSPNILSITTSEPSPTGNSSVVYNVSFDQPVVGFASDDITLLYPQQSAVVDVQGGPQDYQVSISNLQLTGLLSIAIQPGSGIQNAGGDPLAVGKESPVLQIDADVAILDTFDGDLSNVTEDDTLTLHAVFSRDVFNLDASDIDFISGNGLIFRDVTVTGGPADYQILLRNPSAEGTVNIGFRGDHDITDVYGRPAVGIFLQHQVSATKVYPTLISLDANPLPSPPASASLTAVFSEGVMGFDPADLTLSSTNVVYGSITITGGPSEYLVTVNDIVGTGDLEAATAPGFAVQGLDGDDVVQPALPAVHFEIDQDAPQLLGVVPSAEEIVEGNSLSFALSFSRDVTGIDAGDFNLEESGVTHGAVTVTGGPSDYVVEIASAQGEGTLSFGLADTVSITDLQGNALVPYTTRYTVQVRHDRPRLLSITALTTSPSNLDLASFSVQFDRPVIQVDATDFLVSGPPSLSFGTPSIEGQDAGYTLSVPSLAGDGTLELTLSQDNNIVQDGGIGLSEPSPPVASVVIDNTPPTVESITPLTSQVLPGGTAVFHVVFNEDVAGFDAAEDIVLDTDFGGAPVVTVAPAGNGYNVTAASLDGPGHAILRVSGATNATDVAGNPLLPSATSGQVLVVGAGPIVDNISTTYNAPTNAEPVDFSVRFSEVVQNVDASDFIIDAGGASFGTSITQATSRVYVVHVSGLTGEGEVTLTVPIDASIENASGDPLALGLTSAPVHFDKVKPTYVMETAQPAYLDAGAPLQLSLFFDETVRSVLPQDVSITLSDEPINPTVEVFGSGDFFTVQLSGISPDASGLLKVGLSLARVRDLAGNLVAGGDDAQIPVDFVRPSFLGFVPADGRLSAAQPVVTLRFSEPVSGLDAARLTLLPQTVHILSLPQGTLAEIPVALDFAGLRSARLDANVDAAITDAHGQPLDNPGVHSLNLLTDPDRPVLENLIVSPEGPYTEPVNVRVEFHFNEAVTTPQPIEQLVQLVQTGLTGASVKPAANTTPTTPAVILFTGSGEGSLQLTVPADTFTDLSGNAYDAPVATPAYVVDTVPLRIPLVSAEPSTVLPGGTANVSINMNAPLAVAPIVTVRGATTALSAGTPASGEFVYTCQVAPGAEPGPAGIGITATDLFGRGISVTNQEALTIARATPGQIISPFDDAPVTNDVQGAVATDAEGALVAVWTDDVEGAQDTATRIMHAASVDGGDTWSGPEYFSPLQTKTILQTGPAIAYGAGVWVAAWMQRDLSAPAPGQAAVMASTSINKGESWSEPLAIAPLLAGAVDNAVSISPDGAGGWLAAWTDDTARHDGNVYVARGVQNGLRWGDPVLLVDEPHATVHLRNVRIEADDAGTVIALWEHWHPDTFVPVGLSYSRSSDAGQTWQEASIFAPQIAGVNVSLSGADLKSFGAGKFVVAAVSDSTSQTSQVDVYRTEDGGADWLRLPTPYDHEADLHVPNREPGIAVAGDTWSLVWQHNPDAVVAEDRANRNATSFDAGQTWSDALDLNAPGERFLNARVLRFQDNQWGILWEQQPFRHEIYFSSIAPPAEPDLIAPSVTSAAFAGYDPLKHEVTFDVTFSEAVQGFGDDGDIELQLTGTAHTGMEFRPEPSSAVWHVVLTGFSGDGSVRLGVRAGAVTDLSGNPLVASLTSAPVNIDAAPPAVLAFVRRGAGPVTGGDILYDLNFSEPVSGFTARDVAVELRGTAYARITVSGAAAAYVVTLVGIKGDGWLRPGIGGTLETHDAAGNRLTGTAWAPGIVVNTNTGPIVEGELEGEGAAQEADAALVALLQAFFANDIDANHVLDWGEILNAYPAFPTLLFDAVDTTLDGALSVAEILAYRGAGFVHGADLNADGHIDLAELLRVIQLYNAGGYDCASPGQASEDGFTIPADAAGPGPINCQPHTADYIDADNRISLSELLRMVQFYNVGQLSYCPASAAEDMFCAGP